MTDIESCPAWVVLSVGLPTLFLSLVGLVTMLWISVEAVSKLWHAAVDARAAELAHEAAAAQADRGNLS